jgi:hypothetical protein
MKVMRPAEPELEQFASEDAQIFAAFARYVEATRVLNTSGDLDDYSPEETEFTAALQAMRNTGEAKTPAGVALQLRADFDPNDTRWHNVTLYASAEERAAFYRANLGELEYGEPTIAKAIIALEAMGPQPPALPVPLPIVHPTDQPDGRPSTWGEAYAEYRHARAVSEVTDADAPNADELVDAYCLAMDHLIEEVPAPGTAEVLCKLELALERSDAFGGLFPAHQEAILADLRRLSGFPPVDHWQHIVSEFYRLRDADEAERKDGALRRAYEADDIAMDEIGRQYGSRRTRPLDPAGSAKWDERFQIVKEAEDHHTSTFSEPRWAAARRVYATPAPTMEAMLQKIAVAEVEEELDEYVGSIVADLRRLTAEG